MCCCSVVRCNLYTPICSKMSRTCIHLLEVSRISKSWLNQWAWSRRSPCNYLSVDWSSQQVLTVENIVINHCVWSDNLIEIKASRPVRNEFLNWWPGRVLTWGPNKMTRRYDCNTETAL